MITPTERAAKIVILNQAIASLRSALLDAERELARLTMEKTINETTIISAGTRMPVSASAH